jgi:hypothetical protein
MHDFDRAFSVKTSGDRVDSRGPAGRAYWWTPRRDKSLRYVMENHDDLAKALRVLGLPPTGLNKRDVLRRWLKIRSEKVHP